MMVASRLRPPARWQGLLVMTLLALTAVAGPLGQARAQTAAPAAAANAPGGFEYHLGAADKVRVNVFGEDSLTGEFLVSGAGRISMPLIGEVPAMGLTAADLQHAIEVRLEDGYMKSPKVSVEILSFRPFYILGEVNKPGEYPYTSKLTALKAVATAEGFTYRANTKKVYIKRASDTNEQELPLTQQTEVEPGDTIRIAERFF